MCFFVFYTDEGTVMKIKIVLELFNVIPFIFASLIYPFFLLIGYLLAKYFKCFTLNISSIFCFKYFPMYFLMLAFFLFILFFMMAKYIHTHVHRYIQVLKDIAFFICHVLNVEWCLLSIYQCRRAAAAKFRFIKNISFNIYNLNLNVFWIIRLKIACFCVLQFFIVDAVCLKWVTNAIWGTNMTNWKFKLKSKAFDFYSFKLLLP